MTLPLSLAIAATLLSGVAVLLLGLLLVEGRRARASSERYNAALIAALERHLRLVPGTLQKDADAALPAPATPAPARSQRTWEEIERRAQIAFAVEHGLPVPSFPPGDFKRGNQPSYYEPVEIR